MAVTKKIGAANRADLLHFARVNLGCDLPDDAQRASIIAAMRASGYTLDTITMEDEVSDEDLRLPTAPPESHIIPATQMPTGEPAIDKWAIKCTINLHRVEDKGLGKNRAFIRVNDRTALVARGVDVDLALPFVLALLDASQSIYETDDNGNIIDQPRSVPSYPFSLISVPPEARRIIDERNRRYATAARAAAGEHAA